MNEGIAAIQRRLEDWSYIADEAIATALYLAVGMQKPLLIEGEAGVGKTEIARVLARMEGTDLIRLQCYEGLDANMALYEWNYARQMLRIRMMEHTDLSVEEKEKGIFSEEFLLKRPLLDAITRDRSPVLLIDEVDRADEEFEAFCLEVLADFQVTIPELGTITATHRPYVILTSNQTRTLSDALRRRCLYLWMEYPSYEKERRIILAKVPGASEELAAQVAGFLQVLRRQNLSKIPGIAETINWTSALVTLNRDHLDPEAARLTLGALLKDRRDIRRVVGDWLDQALTFVHRSGEEASRIWNAEEAEMPVRVPKLKS